MVTTEKDAVRIPDQFKPVIPLYYLRMEIEIVEDLKILKKLSLRFAIQNQLRTIN